MSGYLLPSGVWHIPDVTDVPRMAWLTAIEFRNSCVSFEKCSSYTAVVDRYLISPVYEAPAQALIDLPVSCLYL